MRNLPRWISPVSWIGLAILYIPLLAVGILSFNATRYGQQWGGFTTAWYAMMATNDAILAAAWNSLLVGVASTVIATVLGTLLALGLHRTPWPRWFRRGSDLAINLPVVTPDIILAIALVGAFAVLREWWAVFKPGLVTLIVAHATFQISFVTLVVSSRLATIGRDQVEAARDLYANTGQIWLRVLLPQLMPGIIAGALLAFTISLDDFVVSFFVSGPDATTLPLLIYASVRRGVTPEIHALSTIIVAGTMLAIIAVAWMQARRDAKPTE
ncbi:MAG: ABC transporter permease [Planctomycetes bacterium]|nr:ABC transporter permease [Planctomycetota bacterium]